MIVRPKDLATEIAELHKHGLPKGFSTGWHSVDEFYTVARGQWTLITGIPASGKSEWLDALLVNLVAQRYDDLDMNGWRFAIFSPENQPLQLHAAKLLEKRLGKPFGFGLNNRISESELADGMAWLQRRFAFVKPDRPTLDGILDEASEWAGALIGLRDMPLGAIIDPWNEVEHWRTGNLTEAEYLSACLSKVRQFSRDINGHVWIVAHPRLLQKDSSGKYPVPTPYDVSGGAHWRNKADACIAIHRDIEANNQAVQVHVQKVRFKHVGRVGVVELRYDKITGRYHDLTTPAPPRDHKRAAAGDASEVEL